MPLKQPIELHTVRDLVAHLEAHTVIASDERGRRAVVATIYSLSGKFMILTPCDENCHHRLKSKDRAVQWLFLKHQDRLAALLRDNVKPWLPEPVKVPHPRDPVDWLQPADSAQLDRRLAELAGS